MKHSWKIIWSLLKNKYVVTILVAIVWFTFFSQYNLLDRYKLSRNIRELQEEKEYYKEKIVSDSTRLHELTTDRDNLEKYAREQYYMKKKNEDVFVVVDQ